MRALLATVGAGDTSRTSFVSASTGRTSIATGSRTLGGSCGPRCSGAGVLGLRDGGRGLGFDRRDDASRSVSVGSGRLGIVAIGTPLAFPSPLPADVCRVGVTGGVKGGGVEGGGGALKDGPGAAGLVRAFLRTGPFGEPAVASNRGELERWRFVKRKRAV